MIKRTSLATSISDQVWLIEKLWQKRRVASVEACKGSNNHNTNLAQKENSIEVHEIYWVARTHCWSE